jgi:hypothetical protein
MEPFPFQRLPQELKTKIIREALPRLIIPEYFDTFKPYSQAEGACVNNLTNSCKEIRSIVNRIRKTVAFGHGKVFFRLDPIRDTLLVNEMCLPKIESTKDWDPAASGLDHHALPIRSLMTQSYCIMAPRGQDHPNCMSSCATSNNPLTASKGGMTIFYISFTQSGQKSLSLLHYLYSLIYHLSKS